MPSAKFYSILKELADEHEQEISALKERTKQELSILTSQVQLLQTTTVCLDTYCGSDGRNVAYNSEGGLGSSQVMSLSDENNPRQVPIIPASTGDVSRPPRPGGFGQVDSNDITLQFSVDIDNAATKTTNKSVDFIPASRPSSSDNQSAYTISEEPKESGIGSDSQTTIRPSRRSRETEASRMSVESDQTIHHMPAHMANLLHKLHFDRVPRLQWHDSWEFYFAVVIILNAGYLGFRVQYLASYKEEHWGESASGLAFCIFFLFELFLRMYTTGSTFFVGQDRGWNVFDTVVVACMVIEEVVSRSFGDSDVAEKLAVLTVLRLLRIMRILRATRLLLHVSGFPHARLLLMTFTKALRVTFWIVLSFISLIYMLSLIIADAAVDRCVRESNKLSFCHRFGSLGRSVSTIYQSFIGGILWGELFDPLDELGTGYTVCFVIFISIFSLVLAQIYTGMLVMEVKRVADLLRNEDFLVEHKMQRERFVSTMMGVFSELDLNDNGALSLNELKAAFNHQVVSAQLSQLEVDIVQAEDLFTLLDADGSGQVSVKEFILGCLRLQGKAKSIDLEKVKQICTSVEFTVEHIQEQLAAMSVERELGSRSLSENARSGLTAGSLPSTSRLAIKKVQSGKTAFASQGKGKDQNITYGTRQLSFANRFAQLELTEKIPTKTGPAVRSIPKTEMRAMLLGELEDIMNVIVTNCAREMWIDPISGARVKPEQVNLYHFNYYVMSPETSAAQVEIHGLEKQDYHENQTLQCVDDKNGRVIGEAIVLKEVHGCDVMVKLAKGAISTWDGLKIVDDQGRECGVPSAVINLESVSYKELVSSTPTRPDWFCCHWWGESVFDFVQCCLAHGRHRKKSCYWVCAYANRQHDLVGDLEDPDSSSFRRAMTLAEGVLLVLDGKAMPFQRIWCGYELFTTVSDPTKMLDIVTQRSKPRLLTEDALPGEGLSDWRARENKFPVKLLAKGLRVKLEDGTSTVPVDKQNILNSMGRNKETGLVDEEIMNKNVSAANHHLRSRMAVAAWPQAIKEGNLKKFDGDGVTEENLPAILKEDYLRTSLHLNLCCLDEVTDYDVAVVGQALPPNLTHVNLSFDSCENVGDGGVTALAIALTPLKLRELYLDFGGCKQLTDQCLKDLVPRLPPTVVELRLVFAFCPMITKAGVQVLAEKLPGSVTKLKATFRGTKHDVAFESVSQLKREFKNFFGVFGGKTRTQDMR